MPRLLDGRTVSGVGDTGICLDDALLVPHAGGPAWVTHAQILGNALLPGQADYHLVTINPADGVPTILWPDEPGADTIAAGANVFAAGLRTAAAYTRVVNDTGRLTLQGLIPWDVDRDTGLALLVEYATGTGLRLLPRGATAPTVVIPTGPVYNARVLAGRVAWVEGQPSGVRPRAYDVLTERELPLQTVTAGNLYQPLVIASATGRLFLLCSGQEGEVWLHPTDDATHGHQLPPGPHYGLDAELEPDGRLHVVWAINAGESAGSLQSVRWSLDVLDGLVPIEPPIIPPDPPIEPPIPPDPPIVPITPPDPPIHPPIPPDPPVVPPIEVPMPIPPVSSWPFVHQAGKPATPVATTEAYPLPEPQASPYNDFEIATRVFEAPMTDYVAAYLEGRAMCIGGVAPDVTTGKTVYLFQQARQHQGQAGRGSGLLDAWRLYVEHGDTPADQWVAGVIAKM